MLTETRRESSSALMSVIRRRAVVDTGAMSGAARLVFTLMQAMFVDKNAK